MNDLRSLYESVDRDAIHRFVDRREQEGLYLEFKSLADGQTFGRNDRQNLAKAVSGFANASGGIVVWGIRAQPDTEGIDAAVECRPIGNVARAMSDLQSDSARATSPIADGVEHRAVPDEGESGYLVTYVPPTEGDPRMAKLGVDHYYKRSGDSFLKMEHFEIADMFGRRPHPTLSLHTVVVPSGRSSGPGGDSYDGSVVLGIENRGRGIARFPSIMLSVGKPYKISYYGLDGNRRTGLPKLPSPSTSLFIGRPIFAGGANDVVHAESVLLITTIELKLRRETHPADLVIEYRITADALRPVEGKHTIPGDMIKAEVVGQAST